MPTAHRDDATVRRASGGDTGSGAGLAPLARRTTVSLIADRLRASIRDGSFPPGTQLGEVRLAEQLQVSRGPVREALQRLIQEGLLVSEPHRGVFVATLGPDDVIDVQLARRAVERTAVERVAELVAAGDGADLLDPAVQVLERMRTAAHAGAWAEVADLDLELHAALVRAAGSTRLSRMYATLVVETRLCLGQLEPSYPVRAELVDEHAALLDAVASGDPATARQALEHHLEDAVERLVRRRPRTGPDDEVAPAHDDQRS